MFNCLKNLEADRDAVIAAVEQNGEALKYAAEPLRADKDFVISLVERNRDALWYAADVLWEDKDFITVAVQRDGRALKYAAEALRADKDFVIALVKRNSDALWYAADALWQDKDFITVAVQRDGKALKYAAEALRADKSVVTAAVKTNCKALRYVADKGCVIFAVQHDGLLLDYVAEGLRGDKDVATNAVKQNKDALRYVSDALWADKDFVLFVVQQQGFLLKYVAEALRADRDVAIAAVKQNSLAIRYVADALWADERFVRLAVRHDGHLLQYAAAALRADKDVAIEAAMQNHKALRHVADALWADKDFVLFAVKRAAGAIYLAAEALRADKDVAIAAVTHHGGIFLRCVAEACRADKDVVTAAVRQCPFALIYAAEPLQANKELARLAVEQNGLAYIIVKKQIMDDKQVTSAALAHSRTRLEHALREIPPWCKSSVDVEHTNQMLSNALSLNAGALNAASMIADVLSSRYPAVKVFIEAVHAEQRRRQAAADLKRAVSEDHAAVPAALTVARDQEVDIALRVCALEALEECARGKWARPLLLAEKLEQGHASEDPAECLRLANDARTLAHETLPHGAVFLVGHARRQACLPWDEITALENRAKRIDAENKLHAVLADGGDLSDPRWEGALPQRHFLWSHFRSISAGHRCASKKRGCGSTGETGKQRRVEELCRALPVRTRLHAKLCHGLVDALANAANGPADLARCFDINCTRVYSCTPKQYGFRGGRPYFKPEGWVRFAVAAPFQNCADWSVAYHGTHVANILPILERGLQRPGDHQSVVKHGQAYSETHRSIYLSPSIEYAAFPTYALFFRDKSEYQHWLQIVLQVRVRPGSFAERPGSLGNKHWPRDVPFERWFPGLEGLEWLIEDASDVVVTGLMVREFGPTADQDVFGDVATRVTNEGGKPEYKWTELRAEEMRRLVGDV